MQHVGSIETIVAQFVVHNLISREIGHHVGIFPRQFIGCKQKDGFRQLTAMKPILCITDGTDRHNHLLHTIAFTQYVYRPGEIFHTFADRQFPLLKQVGRTLAAVVHHLSCCLFHIHMIRAQRQHCHAPLRLPVSHPLDGVEDANGVIHHSERIDRYPETLFLKAFPDAVGKARAYEQHLLKRLYGEVCLRYLDNGSEIHNIWLFDAKIRLFRQKQPKSGGFVDLSHEFITHYYI